MPSKVVSGAQKVTVARATVIFCALKTTLLGIPTHILRTASVFTQGLEVTAAASQPASRILRTASVFAQGLELTSQPASCDCKTYPGVDAGYRANGGRQPEFVGNVKDHSGLNVGHEKE